MKKAAEKSPEEENKPRRRVKKVVGHAAHHGGAWKVAYADFVTAMMALFLVLWLVSQADVKVKQAIASYFRSPGVFSTMDGGILPNAKKVSKEPTSLTSKDEEQTLFAVSETLKKKFASRPEFSNLKDRVQIQVTEDGLKIEILDKAERVSFSVGGSELSDEAKLILAEIAKAICELPNPLIIGGHTDSRIFQSPKGYTNWELSTDRANAARRYLESQCVSPDQIKRIIGYGDSQPLMPQDPYNPANRRISITLARMIRPEDENQTEFVEKSSKEETPLEKLKNELEETKPVSEKPATNKPETVKNSKETANSNVKPTIETLPQANSAEKPKPKIDEVKKTKADEIREAKKKLLSEGSVTIGEPDVFPKRPKN